jgi:predicted 3-demethylubiquinone-9 3-methyltransferase (glyoxalase superfamily)
MSIHPPIPCLWFDTNAEEAVNFYVTHLGGSISKISHYDADSPMPEGTAFVIEFDILGQKFTAMNGGTYYVQTPGVSFTLLCDTQDEIDKIWSILSDGSSMMMCGWVTDKFGTSWQVTPSQMSGWVNSGNALGIERLMVALRQMIKMDIAALEAAFEGAL